MRLINALITGLILIPAQVSAQQIAKLCVHFTTEYKQTHVEIFLDNREIYKGLVTTLMPGVLDLAKEQCVDTVQGKHTIEAKVGGNSKQIEFVVTKNQAWLMIGYNPKAADSSEIVTLKFIVNKPLYD